MEEDRKIALFDHQKCKSRFFAKFEAVGCSKYRGQCPNPRCNRKVSLNPKEMFASTDKARREYIRLSHHRDFQIYWQV